MNETSETPSKIAVKDLCPSLSSIRVLVEERCIDLQVNPLNWRTHDYKELNSIPRELKPAFASPGPHATLDLESIIRQACASGKVETRLEAPYHDGDGRERRTILRTLVVHLSYDNRPRTPSLPRLEFIG